MKYDARSVIELNQSLTSFTEHHGEWMKTEDGKDIDVYYDVNPYQAAIRSGAHAQIRQFEDAFFLENPAPPKDSSNIAPLFSSLGSHQFLFSSGDLGIPVIRCSDNYYDGDYAYKTEKYIKRHMKKEGHTYLYGEMDHNYFTQSYTDDKICAILLKKTDSRENELEVVFFEKSLLERISEKIQNKQKDTIRRKKSNAR